MTRCHKCHHPVESLPPAPSFAEPKKPICGCCAPDNHVYTADDEVVVERIDEEGQ